MELIKDIKDPLEKLRAFNELIEQGKSLIEITEIAGYTRKDTPKRFLEGKGYRFNGDIVCEIPGAEPTKSTD